MELTIIKKQDNLLLSRMEITLEVNFVNEPTPKKEDIKKKIVSSEKADEKLVVVKNMNTSFSSGKANVSVYIYKSEEELKKTEPQNKGKSVKRAPKKEKPIVPNSSSSSKQSSEPTKQSLGKAQTKKEAPKEEKAAPKAEKEAAPKAKAKE